jgi:hypothetical protein
VFFFNYYKTMKVLRLDVYGTIALVDVEFDDKGLLTNCEKLFACPLCPNHAPIDSQGVFGPHNFLEGYRSYFLDKHSHSVVCNTPAHPFRHALLPALQVHDQYKHTIYVARVGPHYTLEPCSQDDVDNISEFVSDFEKRYSIRAQQTSYLGGCLIS